MGVDGIDKADIFDEYFDDNKPKITNFDKIKAMDIDEMAKLIVMIERFCDVAGVNEDGVREWLESEVRE